MTDADVMQAIEIFQEYLDPDIPENSIECKIEADGVRVMLNPNWVVDEDFDKLKSLGFVQEHDYFIFEHQGDSDAPKI